MGFLEVNGGINSARGPLGGSNFDAFPKFTTNGGYVTGYPGTTSKIDGALGIYSVGGGKKSMKYRRKHHKSRKYNKRRKHNLKRGSRKHNLKRGSRKHNLKRGSRKHNLKRGSRKHNLKRGSRKHNLKGGNKQPFSNTPLSFSYGLGSTGGNSALANPMPFTSISNC